MSMTSEDRQMTLALVRKAVADHPDFFMQVVAAAHQGTEDRIRRLEDQNGKSTTAMLAALSLMKENRVSADLRDQLGSVICDAIPRKNASNVEKDVLTMFEGEDAATT